MTFELKRYDVHMTLVVAGRNESVTWHMEAESEVDAAKRARRACLYGVSGKGPYVKTVTEVYGVNGRGPYEQTVTEVAS